VAATRAYNIYYSSEKPI